MRLFYAIVLVLMVLVSACAQQPAAPQTVQPTAPQPEPEAEPEAETIDTGGAAVAVPEEVEETTAPATGDEVRMLGVGQYDPKEVTISAGGSITLFNEGKFKSVVTIKSKSGITNTPILNPGDKYEQEFAEAGEYDVWGVAYGPGVKVTVK